MGRAALIIGQIVLHAANINQIPVGRLVADFAHAKTRIERTAHTIYAQQGVATELARRYFDGASPLFPDVAENVAAQVTEVERVISVFKRGPSRGGATAVQAGASVPTATGPAASRSSRQGPPCRRRWRSRWTSRRAQAWTLIGEREKGYPLVARHVWRQGG